MTKFIKLLAKGAGANATTQINLDELKKLYSTNYFNSLTILNTHASVPLTILLDGEEAGYVTANNGVFEIKPEYALKYNFLALKNDTATALTNEVKVIVGLVGGNL